MQLIMRGLVTDKKLACSLEFGSTLFSFYFPPKTSASSSILSTPSCLNLAQLLSLCARTRLYVCLRNSSSLAVATSSWYKSICINTSFFEI